MYLAGNSRDISFPEMVVGMNIVLRKFKKNCKNNNYCKYMQSFLETVKLNDDLITEKRKGLKQKYLKSTKLAVI